MVLKILTDEKVKNFVIINFGECFKSTKLYSKLQSSNKYLRQTLVFMSNRALQEKFNPYFAGVFC